MGYKNLLAVCMETDVYNTKGRTAWPCRLAEQEKNEAPKHFLKIMHLKTKHLPKS